MKSTITRDIYAFRAARIKPGEFDPAQEFVVCPWGTTQTRRGPVTVNEHTLAVFEANQAAARRDKVAGDFEHNTLRGVEPCKVTGFYAVRVVRGRGVVALASHLTPEAAEVKAGHYPDISPAIERDANGVVEGLHSFAFVRHGEMAHPELEIFSADAAPPSQPKKNTMTDTEMLCELLGLPVEATPEQKAAALATLKAKLDGKPATEPMSADLAAKVQALTDKFAALEKSDAERAVDALCAEAVAAGKKVSLARPHLLALGAEGVTAYLATLPAGVVKFGAENKGAPIAGQPAGDELTETFSVDTLASWKRNGIDPQRMLKAHKARAAEAAGSAAAADDDDAE